MKKKIVVGIIVAAILVVGGVMVIPSIVATEEGYSLDKLGNLIDAYTEKDGGDKEENPSETQGEPVASVNEQYIYQEDIDYEKAYLALETNVEIETEEAIESAAIKKIIIAEASELGFTLSDTEIAEIRAQIDEDYDADLETNNTYAEQLGVSRDDLVDTYLEMCIFLKIKEEYYAYLFEALLDGSITSDNQSVNDLLDKIRTTSIETYEGFGEDVLKVTDLYVRDLLDSSDFEILK